MIVDDSNLIQCRIFNALKKVDENINIAQAGSCEEALERFPLFAPDTVILDLGLPDGSGISLLQKFKKEKPDVHVIVFTNYNTLEFKKSCKDLGADHFFDKSNFSNLINQVYQLNTH